MTGVHRPLTAAQRRAWEQYQADRKQAVDDRQRAREAYVAAPTTATADAFSAAIEHSDEVAWRGPRQAPAAGVPLDVGAARIRRNVTLDIGAVRRARAGAQPASPPTRRGGRMGADGRPWLWVHDDLRNDVGFRVGSLLDLMAGQDRIASLEVRPATPDDGLPSAAAAEFRADTDSENVWATILVDPGLRGRSRRALAIDHEAVHLAHLIEELETAGDDWQKAWTKHNTPAGEELAERLAHHVERQADMRHWSAGGYRQLVRDGLAELAEMEAKAERAVARVAAAKHAKPKPPEPGDGSEILWITPATR